MCLRSWVLQNVGDLHVILCLNASSVVTDRALKLLLLSTGASQYNSERYNVIIKL